MKFVQLLDEKWIASVKTPYNHIPYVDVFGNVSKKEITEIEKESGVNGIRFGFTDNGDVYAWNGIVLHGMIFPFMKSKHNIKLTAGATYYKGKFSIDQLLPSLDGIIGGWESYPKKQKVLGTLYRLIPKGKKVTVGTNNPKTFNIVDLMKRDTDYSDYI